jgi:hypothetical protein
VGAARLARGRRLRWAQRVVFDGLNGVALDGLNGVALDGLNGVALDAPDDPAYELVASVASRGIEPEEIARRLATWH